MGENEKMDVFNMNKVSAHKWMNGQINHGSYTQWMLWKEWDPAIWDTKVAQHRERTPHGLTHVESKKIWSYLSQAQNTYS